MNFPEELKYTKDHEWVKFDAASGVATVGITAFAQNELGDVVFVDLPAVGKTLKQGETACVVESTKAASDVYAPVGGTVKEVNKSLPDSPAAINNDSYNTGWMLKLENVNQADLAKLMDVKAYRAAIGK